MCNQNHARLTTHCHLTRQVFFVIYKFFIFTLFLKCLMITCYLKPFLPHDATQLRHMPSCCVCLSVMFMDSVETNKCIFKKNFTIDWPHHSSFSIPNVVAVFQQGHTLTVAWNASGVALNRVLSQYHRVLSQYLAPLRAVNDWITKCNTLSCAGP